MSGPARILVALFAVGLTACASDRLPTATLEVAGTVEQVSAYSWCWEGQDHNACGSTVLLPDCSGKTSARRVEAGSLARVKVSSTPSYLAVTLTPVGPPNPQAVVPQLDGGGHFSLPRSSGRYLLVISGKWRQGEILYPRCLEIA